MLTLAYAIRPGLNPNAIPGIKAQPVASIAGAKRAYTATRALCGHAPDQITRGIVRDAAGITVATITHAGRVVFAKGHRQ